MEQVRVHCLFLGILLLHGAPSSLGPVVPNPGVGLAAVYVAVCLSPLLPSQGRGPHVPVSNRHGLLKAWQCLTVGERVTKPEKNEPAQAGVAGVSLSGSLLSLSCAVVQS